MAGGTAPVNVTCSQGLVSGRYVSVQRIGTGYLTLCAVNVSGRPSLLHCLLHCQPVSQPTQPTNAANQHIPDTR